MLPAADLAEVEAVVLGTVSELLERWSSDEDWFDELDSVVDGEMSCCAANVGFDLVAKGHEH